MIQVANFSLILAAVFSLFGIFTALVSARGGRDRMLAAAERSLYAVWVYVAIAALCLIYFLVTSDFRIEFVASYTSTTLPLFYRVAALWAGQKGSLLLWSVLLTAFSSIAVYTNRKRNRDVLPYLIAILLSINFFFLFLMLFVSNPFERLAVVPIEGRGLNPLLQNPGMVFHPPSLYLGFVGFSIPFAFAMASMLRWKEGNEWIRSTRRWVLLAWVFLTIGNLLGAQWAYVELGWGGYWAWDPVENAAIMPWFTGTAFLHSVMIQEKKNMLKVWNMVLITITFLLTIFGTFLTRSGVISSVHAFTQTGIGPFFVVFMILIALFALYVVGSRFGLLRTTNRFDSIFSRESMFLFNNLILLGGAFAILWGTVFPMVSEAVRGTQITVGPPFFNAIMVPIGIVLLLLIGIGPLIAWRRASFANLRANFSLPLILALAAGGLLYGRWEVDRLYPLLALMVIVFVLVTIVLEFFRGTRARRKSTGEGAVRALFSLVRKGRRRYGGYLVHLGVVFVYIGITGTAFQVVKEVVLAPGESDEIEGYSVRYEGLKSHTDEHKSAVTATLQLHEKGDGGGLITILKPQKNLYRQPEQATTEVAIHSTPIQDFYVIFAGADDDEVATFRVFINPLVMWLWIGGWVMVLGTLVAIWPDRRAWRRREVLYDLYG